MGNPLFDTPLVQSIGWALIHFIWQGTVIGIATALALRVLAGTRPTTRYAVACLSLTLMLVVPIAAVVVDRVPGSSDVISVTAVTHAVAPAPIARLLPSAVSVWLAGVVLLSIRLMVAWVAVERLKRATRAVDAAVIARVQSLSRRLGISRPIRVFESTLVRVPAVVGYVRPVILLPASVITGLAPAYLDVVLAHELAHVRRHDYVVNALQSLVETLLFYHPAVWWCSRQIRIEREHCCDDMVVEAGSDRLTYATALAQLEELRGLQPMLSLNASGGRLVDRIRRLLYESPIKERKSMTWTITAALAVVTAIVATPGRGVVDARELTARVRLDSPRSKPTPVPSPEYVQQTHVALETLARETQGIVVFAGQADPQPRPQPAPKPQAQPRPQPQSEPLSQSQPQATPQPPQPPQPPMATSVAAPPAPPTPAPLAPVAPLPPKTQIAVPAPPPTPAPPAAPLALDADSFELTMQRAVQEIAASFDELRRATDEINAKQAALAQAQADLAKMRLEALASKAQMEVIRKTLSDFAAKSAASQFDSREVQKLIDELSEQIGRLRAR